MNTSQVVYDEASVLHKLKHYLPAQNPLKDFVHHNTLHAFQAASFHVALQQANQIFGYKTYLPLADFRKRFQQKEISDAIVEEVIKRQFPNQETLVWKERLFHQKYDESQRPNIGKFRSLWKEKYALNLDKATHSTLFRIVCSYLDQGISVWPFPTNQPTFLDALIQMENKSAFSLFKTKRAKSLLFQKTSLTDLLHLVVGDETWFETYLFDQQFTHPGWSGMVSTVEDNPKALLDPRPITLKEFIQFELLLEIDALDQKFGEVWSPLAFQITHNLKSDLFETLKQSELFQVYALWQEALEWTLYDQVLANVSRVPLKPEKETPSFQGLFCMDDRECSFRRHIEHLDPLADTYGTAAFFNFEFYYQPVGGKFFTKSCPAPVEPKFLIKEKDRKKQKVKDLHYHQRTHSAFWGWLITQSLGFVAVFQLLKNLWKPTVTAATNASFKHLPKKSKLIIEHQADYDLINGLQLGFTVEEMANRLEGLLKSIGLVDAFAPLVYVIGHGATSVNNTHYAGYDCGACSGRPSSVNAKVASYAANHPEVRKLLKEKGIHIPETTKFVPALHDTTRDEILFYEEEALDNFHAVLHQNNQKIFLEALTRNAKERSRRLETTHSHDSYKVVHEEVKKRSVSLFEPRPELNHATNAMCIVGRRSLSKTLFLDRRSFLNSFDYEVDPDGNYLSTILNAVAPVAGGINLEYYFSRVDNQKLGAGTKLPHNVMGLIGVANGMDGDLRSGLPSQMIEIHDPLRLLVIVEHRPELVLKAIQRNEKTYEWFYNDWVKLVAVEPTNHSVWVFEKGVFNSYQPIQKSELVHNDPEEMVLYTENLKVGILSKNKTL